MYIYCYINVGELIWDGNIVYVIESMAPMSTVEECCSCAMKLRIKSIKFLVLCVFITFVTGCFIALTPIRIDECKCPKNNVQNEIIDVSSALHKLAVLVPFRDRFEELLSFVPYLHNFLRKQEIVHHIYILNQIDHNRFNRASLINVGFIVTHKEYDYIAMHDVDLLPLNDQLSYAYPHVGPFHVASPDLHPRYHYPTFVGGILLIKREHFELVNGMSNKYWGWGLEDDEFYVRLKDSGLNVTRPLNITTGTGGTFRHTHDRQYRKRDMAKCYNQREETRKRDRVTGLNDVQYNIDSISKMTIDQAPVTVINIELFCNKILTPWCQCETVTDLKKNSTTNKKA